MRKSVFDNPNGTTPAAAPAPSAKKSNTGLYVLGAVAVGGIAVAAMYMYRAQLPEPLKTQFDNFDLWLKSLQGGGGETPPPNGDGLKSSTIDGIVIDSVDTSLKIPNVRVEVKQTDGSWFGVGYTDSKGYVKFEGVPNGVFRVSYTVSGYITNVKNFEITEPAVPPFSADLSTNMTFTGHFESLGITKDKLFKFPSPRTVHEINWSAHFNGWYKQWVEMTIYLVLSSGSEIKVGSSLCGDPWKIEEDCDRSDRWTTYGTGIPISNLGATVSGIRVKETFGGELSNIILNVV